MQGLKALYPEWGGPGAVEVVPADLVRLQPGEFLNDTIIDFYMRWGSSCQSKRADVHIHLGRWWQSCSV